MPRDEFERVPQAPHSLMRDRIVYWLGAQGPSHLTIHMCSIVALIAFVADAIL